MPEDTRTTVEKILDAGVKSTSTDGNSTVFVDPKDLRKQARKNTTRPVVATIKVGNF